MKRQDPNRTIFRRIVPSRWVPFPCPLCKRSVEVHRRDLGADLRCPHCTTWISAPNPRENLPSLIRDPRVLENARHEEAQRLSMAQLERRQRVRPAPRPDHAPELTPETPAPLPAAPAVHRSSARTTPALPPQARPQPDPSTLSCFPSSLYEFRRTGELRRTSASTPQHPHDSGAPPEWDRDLGSIHRVPAPTFYLSKTTKAAWSITGALVILAIGLFISRDLEHRTAPAQQERDRQERLAAERQDREAARLAEATRSNAPIAAARMALGKARWSEALPHIRHADRVSPLMAAYYEENPWSALQLTEVDGGRFANVADRNFYIFEARDAEGKSHALGLEETAAGWKLDWEIFARLAQLEWSRFLKDRPANPHPLRVGVIRRTPTAAMFAATRIPSERAFGIMLYGPDISEGSVYAVLDIQSPLAAALGEQVSFERGRKFILELEFPSTASPSDLVTINRIIEHGWTYLEETPPASPTFQTSTN